MTREERFKAVIDYFKTTRPEAETELVFGNTYELLVAVILSAQCTDKRVNMTTPAFFAQYPDIQSLANANYDDVFAIIKSISFPGNKSRHLLGMAKLVMEKFHGEIPMTVEELQELPGVGRKTANVITSVIDKQPNMAVDTHVFRVSARIGLTYRAKTPLQTELQLVKDIPTELIYKFHHWLILLGSFICIARKPIFNECGLIPLCIYYHTVVLKSKID
jgi:endonuclease-3